MSSKHMYMICFGAVLLGLGLLGFAKILGKTDNKFLVACTAAEGVVVKAAFTNEAYCIDRSVVKVLK